MPNKTKNKNKKNGSVVVIKQQRPKQKQKHPKQRERETTSLGRLGARIGGIAGDAASYIGKIFGMGAYTIQSNALFDASKGIVTPPPLFQTTTDGSVIVCAREFITDITGSTGFTTPVYQAINPANKFLFPRLAQVAPNFEEVEWLGLVFEYNPTSGTAVGSTNTALGTVILATQYDVLDPPFASKVNMESYMFSTSIVPCTPMIHPVECKRKENVSTTLYVAPPSAYVNNGGGTSGIGYPAGADRRLYELGALTCAAVGMQASNNIGELWVSYCVRLKIPKFNDTVSVAHLFTIDGIRTAANPIAGALVSGGSDLPVVVTAGNTFTIPVVGRYMLVCQATGSNIGSAFSMTFGSNFVSNNQAFNNYTVSGVAVFNAGGTQSTLEQYVLVTASGTGAANTITVTGLAGMTGANVDIYILRVPPIFNVAGFF